MYTVLLVDDEESVLDVLRASIDWQALGVNTLLTASDGKMALELFEQSQIDLLVADIQMPVMTGIELIRRVRRHWPATHCVLLTAYGEFEYAKEAIRLGVDNYLLKPVAKDEVVQTIQSTLDNIYRNRHSNDTLLRENTVRRWALGAISGEELSERAAVLGLSLYQPAYCAICMVSRGDASTAMFRTACVEELSKNYDVNSFWDEKSRYVIILGGKTFSMDRLATQLTELAQKLEATETVYLAIGDQVPQAELLHISYHAACDAVEVTDFSRVGFIVPLRKTSNSYDEDILVERLCTLFYEANRGKRTNGFKRVATELAKSAGTSEEMLTHLSSTCVHVLVEEFPMQNGLQEKVYQYVRQEGLPNGKAVVQDTMIGLLEHTRSLFSDCFAKFSPLVQRTVLYIRDSVKKGKGVSIKEFCAQSGATPAYLGHIFKKETGVFFNEYLLRRRINVSITLLMNPNRKIKNISDAVGFASTSYYVKCFREYKGMSPAKYRQGWIDERQRGHHNEA